MSVVVSLARRRDEVDAAIDLTVRVWGEPIVPPALLRALEFAGWYLSVARDGNTVVGMCAGFVGMHSDGPHLHSHVAAVEPGLQGRGIGRALKWHQRAWCLEHDIPHVSWTFDPLVGQNARFNLHHLGAVGARYLVNLYGEMTDDVNRGDESDRLLAWWDLDASRVQLAEAAPIEAAEAPDDAEWVVRDDAGVPVITPSTASTRLVATPPDIVALRRDDPATARRWRRAVRAAMEAGFEDGLRPRDLTRDLAYVLRA